MNEQRRQILEMLSEGKINAEGAERLLDALNVEKQPGQNSKDKDSVLRDKKCRVLHVIVHDHHHQGSGHERVHVKVPLIMLKAGMKLSSLMSGDVFKKVNPPSKGFIIDDEKFDDIDSLIMALEDGPIDIESEGKKVHIFCE